MENNQKKRLQRDDLATITADICGVTDGYVRKVKRMERDNEVVISVYMTLWEHKQKGIEAARKIVANNQNHTKIA